MSDQILPPPDPPSNGTNPNNPALPIPSSSSVDPTPNPAVPTTTTTTTTTTKRQRRPSVRLGEIGEQPAASDTYVPRRNAPKPHPSSFKLPPISSNNNRREDETLTLASSIRSRNPKFPKRNRKIHRTSSSAWSSAAAAADDDDDFRSSDFDDLRRDDSLSPVPESDNHPGANWNNNNNDNINDVYDDDDDHNGGNLGLDEDGGVRSWLNRLGLGRYAPVFEIHEVDDEVLPLLTLEDLKDMGINAVGSRRKMFCAIQKLRKSSSNQF